MKRLQQAGAKFLAEDRGLHDKPVEEPEPEPITKPATAPLFELAAAHDGQPADAWLLMFYRMYGDLDWRLPLRRS